MRLDEIQNALFAAYDIRNAMSNAEKRKPTDNDTYGESLDLIIETLEILETELERAKALDEYLMELEGETT
jgi:hypothetical protein